ncbi:MAG: endonuclease MutS2 [Longimicrobiales bacterium]
MVSPTRPSTRTTQYWKMNEHALQVLQFHEALAVVAGFAAGPLGAQAVRSLRPTDVLSEIEMELQRVEEMQLFLQRADNWAAAALPDLDAQLRKLLVQGSVWEAPAFRDAALMLEAARSSRRALVKLRSAFPLLVLLAERLVELGPMEDQIERAIAADATVRDTASRELARLRRELRGARAKIVERLEAFMAALPARFQVPDASVTVREGRYVVPVRREGRGEVGGLVHDESATGGTLFMEPPVAIDLMNRLRELERAEMREVQRILRELTETLRPHAADLRQSFDALIELDSLYARARYAAQHGGARPKMVAAGTANYTVNAAYHPLLLAAGSPVVPFDLQLESGERTLLVSGPNTGGKTVLLKAIGLISALVQSGVIPPVGAGSVLPLFENVYADIGDEQSIEASLSTFSAHLKNIREILDAATHTSLVLMDEVGSGTDPAEGGALAQAVLTELTRRSTLTVATSHLGQLKLLAGEEPGVVNASLQFDSVELRPTYRLLKGIPGRSYGLAIARRLGFPVATVSAAESLLPRAERDAAQLLNELEVKERAMGEALLAAQAARAEADALRAELETRERQMRGREKDAERRARQQARDLLLHAREEVESTIRELRAQLAQQPEQPVLHEAARAARRRVEEMARQQAERLPAEDAELADEGAGEIAIGSAVRISATGATGRVVELRDTRALVETGGLRLQIPVTGLMAVAAPEKTKPAAARGGWSVQEFEAKTEVDLRGLRADEVASQLQPAVDAAVRADLRSLRIIHGKGTGALRQVVAELLRSDRRVTSFRPGGPGEGGSGVTVAEFE